jgi:hypothetical protein
MRALLKILIVLGLMLNSGGGFGVPAYAKTYAGAAESSHSHSAALQKPHAHGKAAETRHGLPSKSTAHKCKGCDKNANCTHDTCGCIKCLSLLAYVRPANFGGVAFSVLHQPERFAEPPDRARQPPAPPPQS